MMTKEEINAQGWRSSDHFPNVYFVYIGEWCHGLWVLENNKIHIAKSKPPHLNDSKTEVTTLYEGECLDIEAFKSITSTLNIKPPSVDVPINPASSN